MGNTTFLEDSALLTASQEHYLKKYLFGVLINNELVRLQKDPHDTLPNLGGPFDLLDQHANSTTPFLRYLFESIVVPFPFLTGTKDELWPKLQAFMDEWAKVEAGNGVEREEMLRRKRLKKRGERSLVLLYSMSVKSFEQRAQEKERASSALDQAFDQLQLNDPPPLPSQDATAGNSTVNGVRINVVGVRVIKEKRHVREHEHDVKFSRALGCFFLSLAAALLDFFFFLLLQTDGLFLIIIIFALASIGVSCLEHFAGWPRIHCRPSSWSIQTPLYLCKHVKPRISKEVTPINFFPP